MTKWEEFEDEVLDLMWAEGQRLGGGRRRMSLTNRAVADLLDIPLREASRYIQYYLGAQRRGMDTRYVLKRTGRTSNARWSVGQRTADARLIFGQTAEDFHRRIERAFQPDIDRIKALNPRSAAAIERSVQAAVNGLVAMLESIMEIASLNSDE